MEISIGYWSQSQAKLNSDLELHDCQLLSDIIPAPKLIKFYTITLLQLSSAAGFLVAIRRQNTVRVKLANLSTGMDWLLQF